MADFKELDLTADGIKKLLAVHEGGTITFTRIAMGSGELGDVDPKSLKALVKEELSLDISEAYKQGESQYVLRSVIANDAVTQEFKWREIGLFAEDKDSENGEMLYCYGNAGDGVDTIPAAGSARFSKHVAIVAEVSSAATVQIKVPDPDMDYAPAGYGLGGYVKDLLEIDDLDNATRSGLYHIGLDTANKPAWAEGICKVTAFKETGLIVQEAYYNDLMSSNTFKSIRYKYSGTFGKWVDARPKMSLNTEYLTDELYTDLPVYTKIVSGSAALEGWSMIDHGAAVDSILRWAGHAGDLSLPYKDEDGNFVEVYPTAGGIKVYANYPSLAALTVFVQIWYTKAS